MNPARRLAELLYELEKNYGVEFRQTKKQAIPASATLMIVVISYADFSGNDIFGKVGFYGGGVIVIFLIYLFYVEFRMAINDQTPVLSSE